MSHEPRQTKQGLRSLHCESALRPLTALFSSPASTAVVQVALVNARNRALSVANFCIPPTAVLPSSCPLRHCVQAPHGLSGRLRSRQAASGRLGGPIKAQADSADKERAGKISYSIYPTVSVLSPYLSLMCRPVANDRHAARFGQGLPCRRLALLCRQGRNASLCRVATANSQPTGRRSKPFRTATKEARGRPPPLPPIGRGRRQAPPRCSRQQPWRRTSGWQSIQKLSTSRRDSCPPPSSEGRSASQTEGGIPTPLRRSNNRRGTPRPFCRGAIAAKRKAAHETPASQRCDLKHTAMADKTAKEYVAKHNITALFEVREGSPPPAAPPASMPEAVPFGQHTGLR